MGPVFEIDSIILQHARAVGTYEKYPSVRKAQSSNVYEHAVNFWRTETL